MKQMPLFAVEAEAERTLREQYDVLCDYYRDLEARLETARGHFRRLREERDQLRRERDAAEIEARHWKAMYDIALMLRPSQAGRGLRTPEPTLKKLLTLAHPDKWSQGQPATELAHELTLAINAARQPGRGQP